jgi:hypothetical protein
MTNPSWTDRILERPLTGTLAVLLLYTALSVVFTWPLALDLAGLAPAHIDPPFTAWRLGWIAHQLGQGAGPFFDANIFWPDRRTLAYSDAVLLQGLLGSPLIWAGVPVNAVSNLLTIVAIASSAFIAYLLACRLTGHRGASVVAGLVFAFASYRRVHLTHLELQWAQWMPLALLAWHRLLDTGRLRDGLLCAVALLLQLLSSIYYAVFLGIGLAIVGSITLLARRGRVALPALIGLGGGAVVAAMVAMAYAQPYAYAKTRVGDRSLAETTRYSASMSSFLTVSRDNVVYRNVLSTVGEGETELFPGVTPVVLGGAALVPPVTATAVAYLAALGVSADMACGTRGFLFPALREHLSVLRALRAPARFGILVQLALGILAAMGLARLARRWPRYGSALVTAAGCLVMVEYATGPLDVQRLPTRAPAVYDWLKKEPRLVTLELPTPPPQALPFHDPFYMYASTFHWQPLVNGYSGHYSPRYLELVHHMATLPGPEAVEVLTRSGVQRILVHGSFYPRDRYERLILRLEAHPMFHLQGVSHDGIGEVRIYAFLPGFGPAAN